MRLEPTDAVSRPFRLTNAATSREHQSTHGDRNPLWYDTGPRVYSSHGGKKPLTLSVRSESSSPIGRVAQTQVAQGTLTMEEFPQFGETTVKKKISKNIRFLDSFYRAQKYLRLCFETKVKLKGQGQLWVV